MAEKAFTPRRTCEAGEPCQRETDRERSGQGFPVWELLCHTIDDGRGSLSNFKNQPPTSHLGHFGHLGFGRVVSPSEPASGIHNALSAMHRHKTKNHRGSYDACVKASHKNILQ
eukprot:EG_transcript_36851